MNMTNISEEEHEQNILDLYKLLGGAKPMNATDFIKQHSVEKARKVVEGAPEWAMSINFNNGMYYSRMEHKKGDTFLYDIKRLVESVDLIGKYYSIDHAKNHYNNMREALNQYQYENKDIEALSNELEKAIADYELIYSNDMGDDSHIENHISPLCKTESQPVLIVERDNQIIERLKVENVVLQAKVDELQAENKILNQAAATHLRNQNQFMDLYNRLVEQLYPYALDLKEQPNFSFKNCSHSYRLGAVAGYKTASENASFEILEMLKGDVEYIRAQCGMLGGGGEA
jgi:hypothetical protein